MYHSSTYEVPLYIKIQFNTTRISSKLKVASPLVKEIFLFTKYIPPRVKKYQKASITTQIGIDKDQKRVLLGKIIFLCSCLCIMCVMLRIL